MLLLNTFPHPRELRTMRTLLRQWKDSDLPEWVAMNADPDVRRYFTSRLSEEEALAEVGRMRAAIAQRGWGMWALEIPGQPGIAGTVGLHVTTIEAHFVPCVELGWRLKRQAWGQGCATEAAQAAMAFGFRELGLPELVAFTTATNMPSQRVMKRLGMRRDARDDFDHPRIEPGHPLRPHVLFRMTREEMRS